MQFVRIDTNYIKALSLVEPKVQSNSNLLNKDNKPFLGALFKQGNVEYYVPISSPKPKHFGMKNSSDFHKITVVEKGQHKLLSVLNFNNMVPVVPSLYTRIDINLDKDKGLLKKEWEFCRNNAKKLQDKATAFYTRFKKKELTPQEKARTVDFVALEKEMKKYIGLTAIAGASATQPTVSSAATDMLNNMFNPAPTGAQQTLHTSQKKNANISE